ncbi:MAG: hemerythrin domain-containing protein [Marinicaulis sp.]|nr:hemerythrin domain-containing protein [Marinicaulis sp.]
MTVLTAIKKEHDQLSGRLTLLKNEAHAWSHNQEPDYDLLHLLIQYFAKFPDEIHHKKEDLIYNALIGGGVLESEYLKRLKSEHEQMNALTQQFSANLENLAAHHVSPKWSLISDINNYIDVLELHMADEESQFLPLAEIELSNKDLLGVHEIIQTELITDAAKQAFEDLSRLDSDIDQLARKKK